MPHYEIRRPCAYVADGKPYLHRTVGAVVELSEAAAAKLGHRVKRVRSPKIESPPPAPVTQESLAPEASESVSKKGTK